MNKYKYCDKLQPGGREPTLWIIHKGVVHTFTGKHIPGVAAVVDTAEERAGKWSNTTYWLSLSDGAVAVELLAPLHGRVWPENVRADAYARFIRESGANVAFDAFIQALERDFPNSYARMLEGEKALESLESSGISDLVEVVTNRPVLRMPHSDVRLTAADGRSWVIAHEAPIGLEIPNVARLIDKRHVPGYRGGTTTLVFALAPGVKAAPECYPRDSAADPAALGRSN